MDFAAARERMVDTQIARRGIRDPRVLQAMRGVPRHAFVPAALSGDAYDDRPLPIGAGQTISQPYMVAAMTEALGVEAHHRVLEIGTGSGYQTAVLAALADRVVSIERHRPLSEQAARALAAAGVANVHLVVGDGTEGYPPDAPFDRILVTAGARSIPAALEQQLADGGRLVIPVGPPDVQYLTIIDRRSDQFIRREGEACVFVPLITGQS
jgi:protein-L-isoaspartate(D-aspartate) O-methyltransferase